MAEEFTWIARYFAPLAHPDYAYSLKDDAALLPGGPWAITTDTLVSGVHFFGHEAPSLIARKALRVNLSDLAAKGAIPRYYTLALTLPPGTEESWVADFAKGLAEDQQQYKIHVLGGDTTSGPLSITITAFGEAQQGTLIRRSGAKSGDLICVSGTIGDSALGLQQLLASPMASTPLTERYFLPQPRLALGKALHGIATAAADVSDGLIADVGHICNASNLAATLSTSLIPLSPEARQLLAEEKISWESLVTAGDDYEVIFTLPPASKQYLTSLSATVPSITIIGVMQTGQGVQLIHNGTPLSLSRQGFTHF